MADEKTQAEQTAQAGQAAETERGDDAGRADEPQDATSTQQALGDLQRELLDAVSELRAEVARIQFDEARGQLRRWVRENPTLAVCLATGTGILAGRLLTKALTPAPPPPLTERARRRARALAVEAGQRASEVGKDVSKRASDARRQAGRAGKEMQHRAAEAGEQLSRQAREFATTVAEQAATLSEDAARRARTFGENLDKDNVASRAGEAVQAVRASTTKGLADTGDTVRAGVKAGRFGWKAAKLAFMVLMATRGPRWIRKIL